MKISKIALLASWIGLVTCFLGSCDDRAALDRGVFSTSAEQERVTSPNGQLDAVLVRDPYGGAIGGGIYWDVYIVTKGNPIHMKSAKEIFRADSMTNGSLVWKGNHLLEIHYDIAQIEQFRNLWGLHEVEDVGSRGERDFEVEIRLAPTSGDFSLLKSDGGFRNDK
ncbi:MAG: hypothetical protein ACRD5R_05910 [Candidatus Acidiferrales bacterium]